METFPPPVRFDEFPQEEAGVEGLEGITAQGVEDIGNSRAPLRDWPSKVRDLYSEEVVRRVYREEHFLFLLGLFVCISTIIIDLVVNPAMALEGALLRVLAVVPVTALGLVAGARRWSEVLAFCVGASPIAFIAVVVHLALHLPPEFASRYLLATTLIVGIGNITLPYSLRGLVIFDICAILAAFGIMAAGDMTKIAYHADYFIVLAIVAAATLPIAIRFERLRQNNFLLNLRTRIVSRELREANAALRTLSERDPLTGIANRRFFERRFAEGCEASDAQLSDTNMLVAVMMIDLDHFKQFNDTHGHQAGDYCLTLVARALDTLLSEAGGIAARYGGEEFIAAKRVSSNEEAVELAEEARDTIASLLLPVNEADRSLITASIGVGVADRRTKLPLEELVEMADAALYSAKNAGRNRIEFVRAGLPVSENA